MTNDEFKAWRARMGMTVRGCAKELGLSARCVVNYETGNSGGKNSRAVNIPRTAALACWALENGYQADKKENGNE